MTLRGWPPEHPFPESRRESTLGAGPDFPDSSGDRERGKFRPSARSRLTTVAVVGDDGMPLTRSTDEVLAEMLLYQKAIVLGLSLITEVDLLNEVS